MDSERNERIRYFGFAALVGLLLLLNLLGVWKTVFGLDTAAILTVLAGYRIFYNSISALLAGDISADLAICIAVIAALSVGEYLAAAEAMFIMLLGEGLEAYAAGRTSAAISRFVEQMPRRARLLRGGEEVEVDAASLQPGDLVLVRAGERIPADGLVAQGLSTVDESAVTGESLPSDKSAGAGVFSGSLNGPGLLHVTVTRAGDETTLSRVVQLVETARERRAPVERLADRYARYFLPALLLAAALTFYFTRDWSRTVAVLLVACPCALILATPTAMVAAIGGLARRGILVRGGEVLQLAAKVDTIAFDKTGTITEGRLRVEKILTTGRPDNRVLQLAAAAERGSDHPLARVIVAEAERRHLQPLAVGEAQVLPGRGVSCVVDSRTILAGNAAFLAEHGVLTSSAFLEDADRAGATAVLIAEDQELAGAILLRDQLRAGAAEAVARLAAIGIEDRFMLTGDRRRAAEAIAREAGIPAVEAELLPEQKLDRIRQAMARGRFVAMAGEGINDAPALACAHVGIAVAGASDITAEAAGVVYLGHSLEKLPQLFEVSRRAVATAWQNIILFAGLVNLAAVGLAATGIIGPLGAAFTHQLSSFFVMLNSLRLLLVERTGPRRLPPWLAAILSRSGAAGAGAVARRWWRDAAGLLASIDLREVVADAWDRRRQYARPLLYAAAALWMAGGVYTVQPEETGIVERFGRVVNIAGAGLHYKLPWPVERLTLIPARRARAVEIGFRSGQGGVDTEPAAYEWNVQHRSGRFQRRPEEALMLSGDQNMLEGNAVVHYRLRRPVDFLLRQFDGDTTVRCAAESVLRAAVSSASLDDLLTSGRIALEAAIRDALQQRLDRYSAGVEVIGVRLLDVHPSLEVVDAFRDVSGAFEEKNRLINEAEGYRNEQVALARGNASARTANASAYSLGRANRAAGDASRFNQFEEAFRAGAAVNETRLFLETMEQILPGKRKMIVDSSKGRRSLFLIEDGLELGPAALPPLPANQRVRPPE